MDNPPLQTTNDAIVISKKIIFSFIFGIIFTVIIGSILWQIMLTANQTNLVTQSPATDNNNDQIVQTPIPEAQKIPGNYTSHTTFINAYPNYGKFTGLPIGSWLNLKNNTVPSLKSNVAIIAYTVHYQKYSKDALTVLQNIYSLNQDKDTVVIGIANTYAGQAKETDRDQIQQTLIETGVTFPFVIDKENTSIKFAGDFVNQGFPGMIIVDKFGNVRYVHNGAGNYDKLNTAISAIQNDNKPSPQSIDTLVEEYRKAILKYAKADEDSDIDANLASRINDSPFYNVYLKIYKPGVDKTKNIQSSKDVTSAFVIIGQTINEDWIIGVPYDKNYCMMLKQANLPHDDWKQYELIRCQ